MSSLRGFLESSLANQLERVSTCTGKEADEFAMRVRGNLDSLNLYAELRNKGRSHEHARAEAERLVPTEADNELHHLLACLGGRVRGSAAGSGKSVTIWPL